MNRQEAQAATYKPLYGGVQWESAQQWAAYNMMMIDFLGLEFDQWIDAHTPWRVPV